MPQVDKTHMLPQDAGTTDGGLLVAEVLVVLGVLVVIADYVIKFLALGVLPNNRKPSSAMAWLILILIIPMAGFLIFLFLGRTNLGKGRIARQREADDAIRAATDQLPTAPVTEPAYLGSMATLNRNLGSLPLQAGNRMELIPGYQRRDRRHDRRRGRRDGDRRGGVLHLRLGRRDRPVLRGPGGRRRAGRQGAADVRPHGVARHPGLQGVREEARRHGHRLAADAAPCARSRVSSSAPTCATTARSWSSTGGSAFMGSQNLIEPGYNKPKNHAAGREVGRARRPRRRTRPSPRCGRSSPRTGTPRATSG